MSKKYLLIYRSNIDHEQKEPSPSELTAMLAEWRKWKSTFPHIVDMGDGLLPTGKRVRSTAVLEGPTVESKELVSGYSVVQAPTYDDAVTVAKACPILHEPGASVEVREFAGF